MTQTLPPDLPLSLAGAVPLADWGVIRAHGEDAATFLHGQLTQDVQSLQAGEVRLAGYCSAKGRLLATFVVWRTAPDEILLACSADLLAATLRRLKMFVLRARCTLDDATPALAIAGVAMPLAAVADTTPALPPAPGGSVMAGAGTALRLADAAGCARALWVGPAGTAAPWPPTLPPAAWAWLEVQSGVPRVVARTADAFVPQMVNLELVGGVNFRKGCYPGQEVVARSQYRGTLKRRMLLARVDASDGDAPAQPGDEVFAIADPEQPAGQIVLCADWPAAGPWRRAALVEAKRALVGIEPLRGRSGVQGCALHAAALPYSVPAEDN